MCNVVVNASFFAKARRWLQWPCIDAKASMQSQKIWNCQGGVSPKRKFWLSYYLMLRLIITMQSWKQNALVWVLLILSWSNTDTHMVCAMGRHKLQEIACACSTGNSGGCQLFARNLSTVEKQARQRRPQSSWDSGAARHPCAARQPRRQPGLEQTERHVCKSGLGSLELCWGWVFLVEVSGFVFLCN